MVNNWLNGVVPMVSWGPMVKSGGTMRISRCVPTRQNQSETRANTTESRELQGLTQNRKIHTKKHTAAAYALPSCPSKTAFQIALPRRPSKLPFQVALPSCPSKTTFLVQLAFPDGLPSRCPCPSERFVLWFCFGNLAKNQKRRNPDFGFAA